MATSFNLPSYMGGYQQTIVSYVGQAHPLTASVAGVIVVGISGFKGGGGGLYCKTNEADKSFQTMNQAAIEQGKIVSQNDQARIVRGDFLLVVNDPVGVAGKVVACFIMWHEFGHALADRGVGSNVGEKSAWKFELEAITHAKQNGTLPTGCTDAMIRAFVDVRQTVNYGDDQTLLNLVTALEQLLQARPANLTEEYLKVAKLVCVNEMGLWQSLYLQRTVYHRWQNRVLDQTEKSRIKTITGWTWSPLQLK